jgi:hypothetical protein
MGNHGSMIALWLRWFLVWVWEAGMAMGGDLRCVTVTEQWQPAVQWKAFECLAPWDLPLTLLGDLPDVIQQKILWGPNYGISQSQPIIEISDAVSAPRLDEKRRVRVGL